MKRKMSLYRAGLGMAFIACALLYLDCSDALLDEMKDLAAEASRPSILPADGATITAHETITLVFKTGMAPSDVSVSGTMGNGSATWGTTSTTNDTLVLNAANAVSWNAGSSMKLVVTVSEGGESSIYEYGYTVFDGTCVSASTNGSNPGSAGAAGTVLAPIDTIQGGINKTLALYSASEASPAQVRIASGTYGSSCTTSVFVADMEPGISLYGRYNASFASRTAAATIFSDLSSSAITSAPLDPVRAIDASGSMTAATVIDGITVVLGHGGGGSTYHCGIACLSGASPVISGCTIQGGSDATGGFAIGMLCNASSPAISGCSIDPGKSSTHSYGIYAGGSSGGATITGCLVSGGESNWTTGIVTYAGTTVHISFCTIQGGNLSTDGHCIYLSGLASISIDNNIFLSYAAMPPSNKVYAVYESDADADPASFSNNYFGYLDNNNNWYYDEGSTGVGKDNFGTQTINNGSGPINLFANGNTHISL